MGNVEEKRISTTQSFCTMYITTARRKNDLSTKTTGEIARPCDLSPNEFEIASLNSSKSHYCANGSVSFMSRVEVSWRR